MKITIETDKSKISVEFPNYNGCTSECWEKQGKEALDRALKYIFERDLEPRIVQFAPPPGATILPPTEEEKLYKQLVD